MDDIVKQAMLKWPNVPHCYGWLALDGRGAWRMRDAAAQARGLPGDKITHAALIAFIARNYTHDDCGNWFFQNGPQRVYVDLTTAPFIALTDPQHGFVLHTGQPFTTLTSAAMSTSGTLFLANNETVAAVNDLDLAECLKLLEVDGHPVDDTYLLAWLEDDSLPDNIVLAVPGQAPVTLHRLMIPATEYFGFNSTPRESA